MVSASKPRLPRPLWWIGVTVAVLVAGIGLSAVAAGSAPAQSGTADGTVTAQDPDDVYDGAEVQRPQEDPDADVEVDEDTGISPVLVVAAIVILGTLLTLGIMWARGRL